MARRGLRLEQGTLRMKSELVDQHRAAYAASFEKEHGPIDPRLTARLEKLFGRAMEEYPPLTRSQLKQIRAALKGTERHARKIRSRLFLAKT
jgi:hypothetical protein